MADLQVKIAERDVPDFYRMLRDFSCVTSDVSVATRSAIWKRNLKKCTPN